MTQDEIVEMAKQAGLLDMDYEIGQWEIHEFTIFAKLVAEAEREVCAKEAEDSDHVVGGRGYYDQLGDADATVRNIVAAIRARGEA